MRDAPHDVREMLNLIVDSYCFRAKDIKEMDFFRLRLDQLLANAEKRLTAMESLLNDCWWEELIGIRIWFNFNKTVAKQFVKLYARLLKDVKAMKFAIESETCHWTHVVLIKKLQKSIYVVQVETNDLLEEISAKVLQANTSTCRFVISCMTMPIWLLTCTTASIPSQPCRLRDSTTWRSSSSA